MQTPTRLQLLNVVAASDQPADECCETCNGTSRTGPWLVPADIVLATSGEVLLTAPQEAPPLPDSTPRPPLLPSPRAPPLPPPRALPPPRPMTNESLSKCPADALTALASVSDKAAQPADGTPVECINAQVPVHEKDNFHWTWPEVVRHAPSGLPAQYSPHIHWIQT